MNANCRSFRSISSVLIAALAATTSAAAQAPIRPDPREPIRPDPREAIRDDLPIESIIRSDPANSQREQTGDILTIAELAESRKHEGTHAGLYVANMDGQVFLHQTDKINTKRSVVSNLSLRSQDLRPLGMAFADPYLYVYDGDDKQVIALEPELRSLEPVYTYPVRFESPSHLAVSAEGLVAVLDGNTLVLQEKGREPFRHDLTESYHQPAGLNFTSWDTLHVLDGRQRALLTLTLNRLKDGSFRVRARSSELPEHLTLTAMTVFEGNIYFATSNQVYVYFSADQVALPVLAPAYQFEAIGQIALTHDGLYVLHNSVLEWVPRMAPIDIVLEGSLHEGRATLYKLYQHLGESGALPLREERAPSNFTEAELLLAASGALIGPPVTPPAEQVRTYSERDKYGYKQALLEAENQPKNFRGRRSWSRAGGPERDPGTEAWNQLFCQLGNCETFRSVRAGQSIQVPDVHTDERLTSQRVILTGDTLGDTLERLVFSEQFKDQATPSFVRRLNRSLSEKSDEAIAALDKGAWMLPTEKWTATLAIPAADFEDRDSKFWTILEENPDASVLSRSAFTEFSAKATMRTGLALARQPPDDANACDSLKAAMHQWHELIEYPADLPDAGLDRAVRVGVLEFASTAQDSHHAFRSGDESTAWHEVNNLRLSAKPIPASTGPALAPVLDPEAFSREAHHANHVAALIGGRQDDCWSGLLPNARLVLIDLSSGSKVKEQVVDSINSEVLVFNVSQVWHGAQDDLLLTVRDDDRPLWVVAVGNDGKNFQQVDIAPAMARWSRFPNVLTVAATAWDGNLIETVVNADGEVPGTNHGKRHVDLVAPGKEMISAIWDNIYGPATGTSQATPQVAAAAALLVDPLGVGLAPGDAKARLIASAQWSPTYEGRVWGGRLDFDAATAFPDHNIVRTNNGLDQIFAIEFDEDTEIVLDKDETYEARGSDTIEKKKVPFDRVLSLRKHNGKYRVVLREPRSDKLKILLDVTLTTPQNKRLQCSSFERWDNDQADFVESGDCEVGFAINQIEEYIRGKAYKIRWPED